MYLASTFCFFFSRRRQKSTAYLTIAALIKIYLRIFFLNWTVCYIVNVCSLLREIKKKTTHTHTQKLQQQQPFCIVWHSFWSMATLYLKECRQIIDDKMMLSFQGTSHNKVYDGDKRINIVTIIVLAILFCLRFHFCFYFRIQFGHLSTALFAFLFFSFFDLIVLSFHSLFLSSACLECTCRQFV